MSKYDEIAAQNRGVKSKPVTDNMQKKMNGTQPKVEKSAKAK